MEYPAAAVEGLLKKGGLELGEGAMHEFTKLLEEITIDIASEADAISRRAGRKAVSKEDVAAAKGRIL